MQAISGVSPLTNERMKNHVELLQQAFNFSDQGVITIIACLSRHSLSKEAKCPKRTAVGTKL